MNQAPPAVEDQIKELRERSIQTPRPRRILFIGQYANGPTDIVASLKRALENLGHWVFLVDTRRYGRSLIDNEQGNAGGYGPVYVRIQLLKRVFERFRPEVLILCGGGLALRDADRDFLSERDVVSVGITLSDPDVQDSALTYASNFDVHTTNSKLALERYWESGLANTVHFPFGIDRAFVEQGVPEDPSLKADVLCAGHASNRPDRVATMERLAERYTVRVYGNGWPWGAGPVDGRRLVQALRSGRIHVNFPRTRAGHTNVKCGVFESIGAGGVVCTEVFEEMSELFDYGSEIVGYEDTEDLVSKVYFYLQNTAQLEDVRRRGFYRLLNYHLYEHRWLNLFEEIDRKVSEVAKVPAQRDVIPRTIILSGYYGAGNLGDELILEAISTRIEHRCPDARVVIATHRPKAVELEHGLEAFDRRGLDDANEMAQRGAAVVLGGGGLWHEYSFERAGRVSGLFGGATTSPTGLGVLPLLARIYNKEFHVFGLGVGPLYESDAKAFVRFLGTQAASVTVRDQKSRELLLGIPGWKAHVKVAADPVYALELPEFAGGPECSVDDGERPLLINLRPWAGIDEGVLIDRIARSLDRCVGTTGRPIVGVPLMEPDRAVLERLGNSLRKAGPFRIQSECQSLEDLCRLLTESVGLLGMRLHGCLLAHRLGRPVVGIAYDPKVATHFEELERGACLLGIEANEEEIVSACKGLLNSGALLPKDTRDRVRRLEVDAMESMDDLVERLSYAEKSDPRTVVIPQGKGSVALDGTVRNRGAGQGTKVLEASSNNELVTDGVLTSGNEQDPLRKPDVTTKGIGSGRVFYNPSRSPKSGDYVEWYLMTEKLRGSGILTLSIEKPYAGGPARQGRMSLQVLLGGRLALQEDIASWSGVREVQMMWDDANAPKSVAVRSVALRDCEDWGWGVCARLIVRSVSYREVRPYEARYQEGARLPLVACSSPSARVQRKFRGRERLYAPLVRKALKQCAEKLGVPSVRDRRSAKIAGPQRD